MTERDYSDSHPIAPTAKDVPITCYIILTNKDDTVIKSFTEYKEAVKFLKMLRRAGADVSLFKELTT
jgi:hypothetical protein